MESDKHQTQMGFALFVAFAGFAVGTGLIWCGQTQKDAAWGTLAGYAVILLCGAYGLAVFAMTVAAAADYLSSGTPQSMATTSPPKKLRPLGKPDMSADEIGRQVEEINRLKKR